MNRKGLPFYRPAGDVVAREAGVSEQVARRFFADLAAALRRGISEKGGQTPAEAMRELAKALG